MRAVLMDTQLEECWIILLKRNNEIIAKKQISKSAISGTLVDPKLVFKHALDWQTSALVLIHNHPSGNINASEADINLTKKLKKPEIYLIFLSLIISYIPTLDIIAL
jgi:DNA repair protein RadC